MFVLVVLTAAGCGRGAHDRVGGTRAPTPTVMTLATHGSRADLREWVAAVRRLSHGSLRIDVRDGWRSSEVDDERGTIADVRAGKVDLASVPARAYDTMGVTSFRGLLAPFLIDSLALQAKVLAGRVPGRMLPGVGRLGVVGVGLLPGALERTISERPLLAPSDYRFTSIGVRPSRLTAMSLRALGAGARDLPPGKDFAALGGAEQSLPEVVANDYAFVTPGRTLALNATLWPRVTSIVVNPDALEALSPAQRDALRAAAPAAVAPMTRRLASEEDRALHILCRPPHNDEKLFNLAWVTPSDLAAMRRAVHPVYARLERVAQTRGAIAAIEALRPHPDPTQPYVCRGGRPLRLHPSAAVTPLRVTGDLRRTGKQTWSGTVASRTLGRGQLTISGNMLLRDFPVDRGMGLDVRFAKRELRGCVRMTTAPTRDGGHEWSGGGNFASASPALRRYLPVSLRFRGATRASEANHLHGGFVTDEPTGLRC